MAAHVVIIGAGIIGAMSAIHALDAGFKVTILEPGQPGDNHAASYGNAGWLSSHSVLPPASPGTWKQVPKWLLDPLGPLAVRLSYLPRATPWLVRYLGAAWTERQIRQTAKSLRNLLADAPLLHKDVALRAHVGHLIEQRGLLHAFLDREHFEQDRIAWDIRYEQGIRWQELDSATMGTLEPDLDPKYTFGLLVPETGSCLNPGAYLAALVKYAQSRGATIVSTKAVGFDTSKQTGRLLGVYTEIGRIDCDKAVIAVGSRAKALAKIAGDEVPIETERGYHAVIPTACCGPRVPTMFADCKVIVNSMNAGLRVAGQVEIAANDDTPNWRRAEILRDHLLSLYPGLTDSLDAKQIQVWMGRRPSTPDGIPCIGLASGSPDIVHAYGHGHIGLVSSARTGRLVGQLLAETSPEIDLTPFSPQRFRKAFRQSHIVK